MILKKIEITGFKSFAQKSVIDFTVGGKEARITSIVGPNGSGKSNTADAIRWVLGEQSYKLLRSKKSEDIVFTGSEKRQRGSYAEVVLHLDNQKGDLKIDFTEVAISRRLYRNGENEYRINGAKVRLMDIQDLLARCGFGQATYTVIGQGMVDTMLFYGTRERKVLFDEAAGVKQYELRKEQSLRKLDATDKNLIRIKDILGELSPRLKQLKRQVEKGAERKVLEEELKELSGKYYSFKWDSLKGQMEEDEKKKEEIETEKGMIQKDLSTIDEKLYSDEKKNFKQTEALRDEYQNLLDERDKTKEKYIVFSGRLKVEREKEELDEGSRFDEDKKAKEEQTKELRERIEKSERDLKEGESELAEMMKEMSGIQTRLLEVQSDFKGSEGSENTNLLKLKKEYSDLAGAQKILIEGLEKARSLTDILKARERAINISKLLNTFWIKIKDLNKKDTQTEALAKIEKVSKEKEELFKKISDVKVRMGFLESDIANLKDRKKRLEDEVKKITERIASLHSVAKSDEKSKNLIVEIAKVKEELDVLEKNIAIKREKIEEGEKKEQGKKKELLSLREERQKKQSRIDEYNYAIRDLEVSMARVDTRREDLKEEIEREVIGGVSAVEKIKVNHIDLDDIYQKITKMRHRLSIIGGVEEDAEEEYGEVEERYSHLSEQLGDLEKAKDDLRQVVSELDGKIKVQFDEAFAKISKEFKKYFVTLFDGGRADLSLKKSEDEEGENFGIEITACPPGKKVTSLNALSGGERTLTSLALLFAILSVNPSPFCVLDEVDAALDETNTKRFLRILVELSDKTQFIVITHNRDTMRTADILYGVIMNSEHISKLLSLRLKEAESTIS